MRWFSLIVIFSGLPGLSGCVSWPDSGHGGMAEHYHDTLYQVIADQPLGPEHGLRFDLDLARLHLDVLVLEGAELCFPATVIQAKQRQDRITRELHGGLDFDAANNLIIQRTLLSRLERQLDYVRQRDVCITPMTTGQKTPGDFGKRIYNLLNSDNQFAFDSAELNPKYVARLAEAAQLLRDQPGYHLHITGHADAEGQPEYNRSLSLDRAKMVGRYLHILGLPNERLSFDAVGSDHPLFMSDQQAAHIRLVNRRVSIELIENPDSIQVTRE
ncbi:MAG: OmpA family protein [Ectothiorhodospiraceae bacterium]|nr:OmpA family protein [Ectothiorhodospiraceae bacterium]